MTSPAAGGNYLTIAEASELLGVSRMKLYSLIHDGVLPTYLRPLDYKRRYVKRADVLRLKEVVPAQPGRRKKGQPVSE